MPRLLPLALPGAEFHARPGLILTSCWPGGDITGCGQGTSCVRETHFLSMKDPLPVHLGFTVCPAETDSLSEWDPLPGHPGIHFLS